MSRVGRAYESESLAYHMVESALKFARANGGKINCGVEAYARNAAWWILSRERNINGPRHHAEIASTLLSRAVAHLAGVADCDWSYDELERLRTACRHGDCPCRK